MAKLTFKRKPKEEPKELEITDIPVTTSIQPKPCWNCGATAGYSVDLLCLACEVKAK